MIGIKIILGMHTATSTQNGLIAHMGQLKPGGLVKTHDSRTKKKNKIIKEGQFAMTSAWDITIASLGTSCIRVTHVSDVDSSCHADDSPWVIFFFRE